VAFVNVLGPRAEVRNTNSPSRSYFLSKFNESLSFAAVCRRQVFMSFMDFIKRFFNPAAKPQAMRPIRPAAMPPPSVRVQITPPVPKTLNLDAAQFTPISSSAALAQARASTTVRSNPWWGRLDTIPPASDERTLLIDRTLVAYGLLKPEDLVEIHKIGDQMLEIKGDEGLAHVQARAAVDAAESDRKKIKEQKQAESAQRKSNHAKAVAHRKANDIIFLGRGVSRGLAGC
jgi:RNA-directed DNA polymerase